YAGVQALGGAGLRGSVLFAFSSPLLERSCPVDGVDLRDWAAEVTNQVIGRLKNRLAARYPLVLSYPMTLRGQQGAPTPPFDIPRLAFTAPDEAALSLLLHVDLQPFANQLFLKRDEAKVALAEGEFVLF